MRAHSRQRIASSQVELDWRRTKTHLLELIFISAAFDISHLEAARGFCFRNCCVYLAIRFQLKSVFPSGQSKQNYFKCDIFAAARRNKSEADDLHSINADRIIFILGLHTPCKYGKQNFNFARFYLKTWGYIIFIFDKSYNYFLFKIFY